MNIVYTKHAKQRMIERDIQQQEIQETIEFPDYTIVRGIKIEAHKKINNKYLKIVYNKLGKFIKIITVINI